MKKINKKCYFNKKWKYLEIYLVPIKFSIPSKKIREKFIEILNKTKSVADLGCGLGGNAILFQKINPKIKYIGVDISNEAIIKAKKINRNEKINFLVDDLEKSILPKDYFTTIYCSQLIEHIKDDERFIYTINQSLKTGGNLLISTVYRKPLAVYLYKNINNERVLAPDHINEYTNINDLFVKLKKCGFKIIDYDLSIFKFPLIDIFLKLLMKSFKSKNLVKIVNSSLIMFIRYYLSVPIFGFYNFQIIAKKVKTIKL
jgi:2-polyprenyl-3-methyl-5-hydroxy-6-metoxy-1,4-benzoquinol methylase